MQAQEIEHYLAELGAAVESQGIVCATNKSRLTVTMELVSKGPQPQTCYYKNQAICS